jgi:hypothetical protein
VVRWRWLSKSYIPYAKTILSPVNFNALQAVHTTDKDVSAQLLETLSGPSTWFRQTACLGRRPVSLLQQMKLTARCTGSSLGSVFGGGGIIPAVCFSTTQAVFSGFLWKLQVLWVQDKGDTGVWGLGMAVEVKGPLGAVLKSGCMLGGEFEARVKGKLVHRARHYWWHDSSCGFVLCNNLLGQKFAGGS